MPPELVLIMSSLLLTHVSECQLYTGASRIQKRALDHLELQATEGLSTWVLELNSSPPEEQHAVLH